MKLHDIQGSHHPLSASWDTAIAVSSATDFIVIGRAPFRSNVVGAYFIPAVTVTGSATDNRELEIRNRGSAGTGTTVAAEITYTGSVVATAYIDNVVTVTGTAADFAVAEGDVLVVYRGTNGDGSLFPAGQVVVELQAR